MQAADRFVTEADRYRETLQKELFSKIIRDIYPNGGVSMGMRANINMAQLPEFRLPREGVAASLQGSDLAILLIWFLLSASLTYYALARYDVR